MDFRGYLLVGSIATSIHVLTRHYSPRPLNVLKRKDLYIYAPFGKMIYSDKLPVIKNFILFDRVIFDNEIKYSYRRFYIKYIDLLTSL
jgi:hypothetical protein